MQRGMLLRQILICKSQGLCHLQLLCKAVKHLVALSKMSRSRGLKTGQECKDSSREFKEFIWAHCKINNLFGTLGLAEQIDFARQKRRQNVRVASVRLIRFRQPNENNFKLTIEAQNVIQHRDNRHSKYGPRTSSSGQRRPTK